MTKVTTNMLAERDQAGEPDQDGAAWFPSAPKEAIQELSK